MRVRHCRETRTTTQDVRGFVFWHTWDLPPPQKRRVSFSKRPWPKIWIRCFWPPKSDESDVVFPQPISARDTTTKTDG